MRSALLSLALAGGLILLLATYAFVENFQIVCAVKNLAVHGGNQETFDEDSSIKPMKTIWFKRWGWLYRPISLPGFAIVTSALLFCAQVFWAVDRKSHSATDTLYGVFPFFVCCFLLLDWIGARTSDGLD